MLTFDGIDPLAPPAVMVVVVVCTFQRGLSLAYKMASNLMTSNLVTMVTSQTWKKGRGHALPLGEKVRPCDSCE